MYMPESPAPKKRGRKPKKKTEVKLVKKRGRKPKKVEPQDVPELNDKKTYILHIPIIDKDLISSDVIVENEPIPYCPDNNFSEYVEKNILESDDSSKNINFMIIQDSDEKISDPHNDYTSSTDKYIKKNLKLIMPEFIESNSRKSWPVSVKIDCLWCCHSFKNIPIGLPQKYLNGNFYVTGNYCSFNCCASYIFNSLFVSCRKWEMFSLLNLMKKKLLNIERYENKIKLAPPRESLKKFGGFYNILDFRKASVLENKTFNIINPPMISVIPKIEENIMNYSLKNEESFIPLNKELVKKAGRSLKLKRKEKSSKNKNTLKNYMNLKIV